MKKILIIEAELESRRNISALLRELDYNPIEAENGPGGVELAKREKPDLILCDFKTTELDGHGFLQAMKRDAGLASIPLVFLIDQGEKADVRHGTNLQANDYLTKPVANAELVRVIEALLRPSRRRIKREFKPDFSSSDPLLKLNLTPRTAETLLWLAQGKTNHDIATILGITESTVKKHVQEIFKKLDVETRSAATVRALEVLGSKSRRRRQNNADSLTDGESVRETNTTIFKTPRSDIADASIK
jgi:DNA-binding NarL/FixJ family response regulator